MFDNDGHLRYILFLHPRNLYSKGGKHFFFKESKRIEHFTTLEHLLQEETYIS